jgi:iron complex outermembrane receptor protein
MQAENLRIDGLFFDEQTQSSNPYLFSGSDMRVGIAAQAYAFPSPSGIADRTLRAPGDSALTSAVLIRGPLDVSSTEIDAQYPLAEHALSVGLILAAAHGFDYNYALRSNRRALSLLVRFTPGPGTELLPFIGYIHNTEWQETPYVYADGIHPLPIFDEQRRRRAGPRFAGISSPRGSSPGSPSPTPGACVGDCSARRMRTTGTSTICCSG